jgi:hypothetical protein
MRTHFEADNLTNMKILKNTCLRLLWAAAAVCLLGLSACSSGGDTAGRTRTANDGNSEGAAPYNPETGRFLRPWPLGSEQNRS